MAPGTVSTIANEMLIGMFVYTLRSSSSKYYTYHIGHQKRTPVLPESYYSSSRSGQDSTRKASPHLGNAAEERTTTKDVYNDGEFDTGSKSPMGRLDMWSDRRSFGNENDWSFKERSKSLSYSQSQLQKKAGISGSTAIPPPLDMLKKRTSVVNALHGDQFGSAKRSHSSSGSMHDMKSDSTGDLSSPKALDSGALFGASLGFLGSSGSLNDIHAKM